MDKFFSLSEDDLVNCCVHLTVPCACQHTVKSHLTVAFLVCRLMQRVNKLTKYIIRSLKSEGEGKHMFWCSHSKLLSASGN